MALLKRNSLYLAWIISLIATMGSIYFGEISGKEPCYLCWYQRICLFPLIFILGVATYKGAHLIIQYVGYQIAAGLLIASYQIIKELFPQDLPTCGGSQPCTAEKIFSIFNFSWLSFASFFLILIFLLLAIRKVES